MVNNMNIEQLQELLRAAVKQGISPKTSVVLLSADMNELQDIEELTDIYQAECGYVRNNRPKMAHSIIRGDVLLLGSVNAVYDETVEIVKCIETEE